MGGFFIGGGRKDQIQFAGSYMSKYRFKKFRKYNLFLKDFHALGKFAPAGYLATGLALERAEKSFHQGRIPIAGAAVLLNQNNKLAVVTVGNNGRIPVTATKKGYPTDHGETAAIRAIKNVDQIPWDRVVFATTLSPCIMCSRTLEYLFNLGLRRIAVAEAKSFAGTLPRLKKMGFKVVGLTNKFGVNMMRTFATKYPWDWAADIGEIPADPIFSKKIPFLVRELKRLLRQVISIIPKGNKQFPLAAAVIDKHKNIQSLVFDQREKSGHNPTLSAPMLAMGKAGAAVNLRNTVLVVATNKVNTQKISLEEFGHSSLGACELFRPAYLVTNVGLDKSLANSLKQAQVNTINI